MTSTAYVPILLTKRGELSAVTDLRDDVQNGITPMFVVHPVDVDFETDTPLKSVSEHVAGLGKKIAASWRTPRAFVDPAFVIDDVDPTGGLRTLVDEAADGGLQLVPVVSPGRPDPYITTAAELHRSADCGTCVRLSPRHWPSTPQARAALDALLAPLGTAPEDVDLVLDLGDEVHTELVGTLARLALANLPYSDRWRSVTLAGAAFPRDLAGLPKNRISRVPRLEWQLYRDIASEMAAAGQRVPSFGDYAVAHPDPFLTTNPRFLNISGSLRYTAGEEWLVGKGHELFKGRRAAGGEAVRPVAQMIAAAEEFCGPTFSEGDAWIDRVARDETASGGNPERWRRTATNHHLTFVTNQLATRSGS